jgi:ABC-type transporter Mla subunit MlaD
MAARQPDEFKLGLTVLIIVALFLGTVFFIGDVGGWGRKTEVFEVRFPHDLTLPDLKAGGAVRCGGQEVGSVQSVELRELSPDSGASGSAVGEAQGESQLVVVVKIEVDRTVGLRRDCRIAAEGPTLGGAGWLVIRNRGTSPQPASKDEPIEGQPPGGFAAVTETLGEIGGNLAAELDPKNPQGLLANIKGQLDATIATSLLGKIHRSIDDINIMTHALQKQMDVAERQALLAKLSRTMDDVNAITGELRRQMDPKGERVAMTKIHGALDGVNSALDQVVEMLKENRQPVHETILHVRQTAETLDERIANAVAEQLDVKAHASLMAKIHEDVDRIGQSLADIKQITSDLREGMTFNKPAIDQTIANVKQTSDHLKAASKDLRRNPWRLLYRPTDKETDELNVFDAARAFADAATELDDASARLEALSRARAGAIEPNDPELVLVREQLTASFEKFSEAEAALWKILNIH